MAGDEWMICSFQGNLDSRWRGSAGMRCDSNRLEAFEQRDKNEK